MAQMHSNSVKALYSTDTVCLLVIDLDILTRTDLFCGVNREHKGVISGAF